MSPEQAKGRAVDKRTDVWAFGAVLYEMLTGNRAFDAGDVSDTLAAILMKEPDWSALPSTTPPAVALTLQRCLQKDIKHRVRDIGDVSLALGGAFQAEVAQSTQDEIAAAARKPVALRQLVVVGLVTLVVGALGSGVIVWRASQPAAPLVGRFTITSHRSEPLVIGEVTMDIAISPDGQRIAYLTGRGVTRGLHVRELDELTPTTLATGGVSWDLEFSPDGRSLAFFDINRRTLRRVSVDGGRVETIGETGNIRGVSWGPDGTIFFSTLSSDDGLWRIQASGGEPEPVTTPDPIRDERNHIWPDILPGGEAVLFTVLTTEDSVIESLSLETGIRNVLIRGGSRPRYVPTGHLVYSVGDTLRAIPFAVGRLETIGDPILVNENLWVGDFEASNFDVSENGSLLYVSSDAVPQVQLGWVDREGRFLDPVLNRLSHSPLLSLDGKLIAFVRAEGGEGNYWIREIETEREWRLTDDGNNTFAAWTPNSATLTFGSDRAGNFEIYSRPVDLSAESERLLETTIDTVPGSWSPDGETLVYYEVNDDGTARNIWAMSDGSEPVPILQTQYNERAPRLSPDGEWMAYVSNRSGEDRVYVQRFPDGGRVISISVGPAAEPVWSRDGTELFYRNGNELWAVEVETEPDFVPATPVLLFEEPYENDADSNLGNPNYDVSLDGERFLMIARESAGNTSGLVLVQNWLEELKELVPVP